VQSSKSTDDDLRSRIDTLLLLLLVIGILGTILVCLMVTIETLISNQYILFPLVQLGFQVVAFIILKFSREQEDNEVNSGTKIVSKSPHSGYIVAKPIQTLSSSTSHVLDTSMMGDPFPATTPSKFTSETDLTKPPSPSSQGSPSAV